MKTLGFTGTRNVTRNVAIDLLMPWFITDFRRYDHFVTGGCQGFDEYVGMGLAYAFPAKRHTVIVPSNRLQVAVWWPDVKTYVEDLGGVFEVIEMPQGTTYKDRNEAIVNRSDELFYLADYPEQDSNSRRSGTWQTVRLARKKGVPVDGVVVNS